MISVSGRYVMANPAVAAVLGRPVEQILGTDPIDFLYEDDQEQSREVLQALRTRCWAWPAAKIIGRSVTTVIGVRHDIREQVQRARKLQHLAGHDPVAGLPNRRTVVVTRSLWWTTVPPERRQPR